MAYMANLSKLTILGTAMLSVATDLQVASGAELGLNVALDVAAANAIEAAVTMLEAVGLAVAAETTAMATGKTARAISAGGGL